ncbi:MAG: FUSC family protein, partial [Ferruginibacter sp.]
LRGEFYEADPDYEKTYQSLLEQQVKIQNQQSLLSDLLFKTRTIVRESTQKGRVLLKIYVDVAELFESIMTGFRDYKILHQQFDDTGILTKLGNHILSLTEEMKGIGLAVKSGSHSLATNNNLSSVKEIRTLFESMRQHYMNKENLDDFISLGRIVSNVQYLTEKIHGLHHYTSYDKKIKKATGDSVDQSNYAETQDLRPAIFFNNLNFQSNIFRHSVRVTVALLVGYLTSLVFHIGHSYWILLTIVVILKPAYSLTKRRNKDRLIGTVLGIVSGAVLLYFIKDKTALLIIMLICMVISYSFIRTNYFIMVLAMTPYLVIFFHFLYPATLRILLVDRVIDTAIGSLIAFVASIFFVPAWEHTTIKSYMVKMLDANLDYYNMIAGAYSSEKKPVVKEFKLVRRNLLTALANVSDAFNRMLTEPKRFQKSATNIHRFVVLNHILTSHFATLSYYLNVKENRFRSIDLLPVIENTQFSFQSAVHSLELKEGEPEQADRYSLNKINEHAMYLLEKRREEVLLGNLETSTKQELVEVKSVIDQFNYIYNIAADIAKCSKEIPSE